MGAGNRNSLWVGTKLRLAPFAIPSCAEKPLASEEPLSKSLFGPPLESAFDHEDFTGRGGMHCRRCGGAILSGDLVGMGIMEARLGGRDRVEGLPTDMGSDS